MGGGITPENAGDYLNAGASHVIVTSYVFREGRIDYDRLERLVYAVGRERLVLDVSCKRVGEKYLVVTDRWQKLTEEIVNEALLEKLSAYCGEFLIHAVDVEGKARGIEQDLVKNLGGYTGNPVTYAGGVHSMEDLLLLKEVGRNRMNVTIGSAPVRRQYEVERRTEDMQRGSLMNIKMPQANNVCGILYAVVL